MVVIVMGAITYFLLHDARDEIRGVEEKIKSINDQEIQAQLDEFLYPNYADYAIRISYEENTIATSDEWEDFAEEDQYDSVWIGPFGYSFEEGIYYKKDLTLGEVEGAQDLTIRVQLEDETEFLGILLQVFLFIGVTFLLIGSYIIFRITKRRLRPLLTITDEIKEMKHRHDPIHRINEPEDPKELTELAQTFNQLLEKLANQIEREKGFVANASHELKTPLTAFRGHINLLKRWGKKDEDILEQSLQALDEESGRMERMMHQMLTLARQENDHLQADPVHVTEVLRSLVAEYQERSLLPVEIQVEEKLTLMGDGEQLRQVFVILLENALRYTTEGKVSINAIQQGNDLMISVRDTGVGIPYEEQDKIFNRFYRVDSHRSRETGGTGLGLPIAKAIIEKHMGTIEVKSEPGEGSSFLVKLPLKR